ncbi:symmetrical bis(5'-nucleosyl)-tetraphosphatase [Suttonella sp. R2A3]|uniref:symmetrical bis(5'-nucleosyl)-tetraphosphatase n=1 Tax=Suttonella sp. R2A3 TaxID=2908648 RepID=UPI001F183B82|nr:symmetrical bis(5'-nucleosyl)-tetraphosphatase [Suttonella sp. R2A3]UJF24147.1 symmetrical bis(5'-nucleosyl)-tetraphosphatase [Suttonella sp. R2A3]
MAIYAIGDVHGQYDALQRLLDQLSPTSNDELWFVGDLINRGPKSLEVLRYVRGLGKQAKVVLGNHDFAFLVQAQGYKGIELKKAGREIMAADDGEELLNYLRHLPLLHINEQYKIIMVHAGLFPKWQVADALVANQAIMHGLQGENYRNFLLSVFGNKPQDGKHARTALDKARFAVNVFCRMRYLDKQGRLDFDAKMAPENAPAHLKPWFYFHGQRDYRVIFGHWAALGFRIGADAACLDAGAAWGGSLVGLDVIKWHLAAKAKVNL